MRLLLRWWYRGRAVYLEASLANAEAQLAQDRADFDVRALLLRRVRAKLALLESPQTLLRQSLRGRL